MRKEWEYNLDQLHISAVSPLVSRYQRGLHKGGEFQLRRCFRGSKGENVSDEDGKDLYKDIAKWMGINYQHL